ncbi:hypothetical protein DPMN_003485 [Dreissena polymorpha]|uniref:Uncharacterized protein n=1 Tax=Dreissena polymorpha TaxID=45954 RepID=A0A9D4MNZ0_DREPO|nr:hypothetical protein DPMN_003485 [Dreissena polymorpha]
MHLSFYRTINELEAQLDYERLRREKLEAQLDQYRRDMADLSYRLQAKLGDDSDVNRIMKLHRNIDHDWQMTPIDFQVTRSKVKVTSESDAGYGHQSRQSTKQRVVKKRSGLKKRSQDEGGVFIKRNVSKEKRGARYQKVV